MTDIRRSECGVLTGRRSKLCPRVPRDAFSLSMLNGTVTVATGLSERRTAPQRAGGAQSHTPSAEHRGQTVLRPDGSRRPRLWSSTPRPTLDGDLTVLRRYNSRPAGEDGDGALARRDRNRPGEKVQSVQSSEPTLGSLIGSPGFT